MSLCSLQVDIFYMQISFLLTLPGMGEVKGGWEGWGAMGGGGGWEHGNSCNIYEY